MSVLFALSTITLLMESASFSVDVNLGVIALQSSVDFKTDVELWVFTGAVKHNTIAITVVPGFQGLTDIA